MEIRALLVLSRGKSKDETTFQPLRSEHFVGKLSTDISCPAGQLLPIRSRTDSGLAGQTVVDVYLPKIEGVEIETWVDNLRIPWTLLFLPNGDALVSERPGGILRIPEGESEAVTYLEINAHHPDFEVHPYVYVIYSYTKMVAGRHASNS